MRLANEEIVLVAPLPEVPLQVPYLYLTLQAGSVINRWQVVMNRAKGCTNLQVHEPVVAQEEVFSVG